MPITSVTLNAIHNFGVDKAPTANSDYSKQAKMRDTMAFGSPVYAP